MSTLRPVYGDKAPSAGHLGNWRRTASCADLDVIIWLGWWISLAALVAIGLM